MIHEIADAFRSNNLEAYQESRYPHIGDGEWLTIAWEDLTGVDFSKFSLGYTAFKNCKLDGTTGVHGQPIVIEGCTAENMDLRGTSTVIDARDSDFTGMMYDGDTILADRNGGEAARSVFTNCGTDLSTKEHFKEQGVVFREYKEL